MTTAAPLLSLAIGAALLGLVTQFMIPPATWFALALLLHASRSMPAGRGTVLIWMAVYTALVLGNRGLLPVDGLPYFGINALLTTTVVVPFVVDRLAASRFAGLASTVIFPMAFVAAEFLRSRFTPAATWNSLAYTQYGYLPLMQIAAFVGIWGITFLIGWTASTFEWAWARNLEWSVIRVPVAAWGAALALTVLGGSIRVALAPTDRASMRVVTLNRPLDLFVPGRDDEDRVGPSVACRASLFRRKARSSARVVSGGQSP